MKTKAMLAIVWIVALMLSLSGCGSGGSDGTTTVNPSETGSGTVALMLTDGPADDYDHIWITISRAVLLTAQGESQVVIFDPNVPVEYDLLNLRPGDDNDAGELLAVKDVPAGLYAKIRLEVDAVRGETILPDGSTVETLFRLPSGKIDLNPRGQFYVAPNTTIAVTLDIDCDKSIHTSGNHKNFRPVVFVNIETVDQLERCPRFLHGTITALTYAPDEVTVAGFELTLLNSGLSLNVNIDPSTIIIDDNGVPSDAQSLAVGDTVFVRAELNTDGLMAAMVVVGDLDRYAGVVDQPVTNNQFVLDTYLNTTGDERIVELIPNTLILWGCGEQVTPDAIQPGIRARVVGKVQGDGRIIALVVLLSPRYVTGQLELVEATVGGYQLGINIAKVNETPDYLSVFLPSGTSINVKFDGPLTGDELMAMVACQARPVMLALDRTVPPPLTAAMITILPESLLATVIEVNPVERKISTDQGLLAVHDPARIFDLTSIGQPTADFSDIAPDDLIMLYGQSQCYPEETSFLAHVVLILP